MWIYTLSPRKRLYRMRQNWFEMVSMVFLKWWKTQTAEKHIVEMEAHKKRQCQRKLRKIKLGDGILKTDGAEMEHICIYICIYSAPRKNGKC